MSNIKAVVFDLYGTLYDVHSVATLSEQVHPGQGRRISLLWRQKQLEYTWLRSLMGRFADFEEVTQDALVFACAQLGLPLDPQAQRQLCDAYLHLKPFPEVPAALEALRSRSLPLAILSNGSSHSVGAVVRHSGLAGAFDHLLSVDEVRVFKPHPSVYELVPERLGVERAQVLFVSSNAWDVTGAREFGFQTVWIDRAKSTFDQMGHRPDHIATGVDGVVPLVDTLRIGAA